MNKSMSRNGKNSKDFNQKAKKETIFKPRVDLKNVMKKIAS